MDNGIKNNRGGESLYNSIDTQMSIRYGVVKLLETNTGNKDTGLNRIKVYIKGSPTSGGDGDRPDESLTDDMINQLPWCSPLLPKHLQVTPKVGEVVWVFTLSKNNQHADRLYMGPVISQSPNLQKDPFQFSALAGFTFGVQRPNVNPKQIPELKGVFPKEDAISIQGRFNTDITQNDNEIIIRAGKFVKSDTPKNPYKIKFNNQTQAYIQLKNDVVVKPKTETQDEKKGTVVNMVANKINLLTHDDTSPRYQLMGQDDLISDKSMLEILSTAHPIPYGDVVVEYLRLFRYALLDHVHNGNGNKPTDLTISGNRQSMALFMAKAEELENRMLSANVRIN